MRRCRDAARKASREKPDQRCARRGRFRLRDFAGSKGRAIDGRAARSADAEQLHVWFNYSIGAAIDILIGNQRPFDAATNQELFASFVGSQGPDLGAVSNASQQLHSVMAEARQFLATAIADNPFVDAGDRRWGRAGLDSEPATS